MARPKKTNRGSPEAIAKRRAARALNQAFSERAAAPTIDGRTLKRKKRLLAELKGGRKGQPLKALDVLQHSHELLQLGESVASIQKLKPKTPPPPPMTEEVIATIREAQASYHFDPRAWALLGIDEAVVGANGSNGRSTSKKRAGASTKARKKASSNGRAARHTSS